MASSQIPIIDFSPYLDSASSQESRRAVADALAAACRIQGCVAIKGIDWSTDKLKDLFVMSERLFSLPLEDKLKAPHPTDTYSPHRGYSPVGNEKAYNNAELEADSERERASGRRIVDFKESYEIGSEENDHDYNIWLPEALLPGFRALTLRAFWELHDISMQILEALTLGLGMSEEDRKAVTSIHTGMNDQLRLLHYPPIPEAQVDDEMLGRMPAHVDFSTFTLLFQDSCGGLEFEDRHLQGKPGDNPAFLPAKPGNGIVHLNVGEMLTRLTNDYLPSATHRVTIPSKRTRINDTIMTPPRFSIPFFFMPDPLAPIGPLKSMTQGQSHYESITNREYGEWKSRWTYKQK